MKEKGNRMYGFKRKIWYILFGVLALAGLMAFFSVHPLYIYDSDDWYYISFSRSPLPDARQWNPTKILPETMFPLCAEIAVRFVMPFTGDYIGAMGKMFAMVTSLCIIGYMMGFGKHLSSVYEVEPKKSVIIMTLILLLHFLVFNTEASGNTHMFWADNVNCVFNYTIPGLLNGLLFFELFSMTPETMKKDRGCIRLGVLLLMMYLAINSNMFQSIIISSLAGARLLVSAVGNIAKTADGKSKKCLVKSYINKNILWLFVMIFWLLSLVYEVQGGRASKAISGLRNLPVKETLQRFVSRMFSVNTIYIVTISLMILLGLILCLYRKIKGKWNGKDLLYLENLGIEFLCMLITTVYLILLCSKVYPYYIERSYVLFAMIFFLMVMTASSMAYVITNVPICTVFLPLLCYIFLVETVIDGRSFADYNVMQYSAKKVKILDNYYMDQIIDADKLGLTEVEIHVAKHPSDRWPLGISDGGTKFARSLYNHGLISRMISVSLVADEMVNKVYCLPD